MTEPHAHPQPHRWSLRHRITAAYVLLACAVCASFGLAALWVVRTLEDRLIDQRLVRMADWVVERQHQGERLDMPPNVGLYWDEAIPPAWRGLAPGLYDLPLKGQSVNVLVRKVGARTLVLSDDDDDFDRVEWEIYTLLGAAFAASVALAVVIGRATASRVIAPVTALAQAVQQDRLPQELPNLDLRDEIGVLARAFAERTDALHRFLRRERWFVGDVSHELRTPLTVILGAAEVLGARTAGRPDLHELAERIRRTAVDTTERVSALLLLSRAPEAMDAPRTPLLALARLEVERCRPLLSGKDVALTLDAPDEVHAQARPELAAIAIGNLVRNACQFTDRGAVVVRLRPGRVEVQDTGSGIPEHLQERIFERGVRIRPDASVGSGLGLAIVRRVAEHLDWRIALDSPAGGGSRFTLSWDDAADARP
jgi:signal transduction histidine kinase